MFKYKNLRNLVKVLEKMYMFIKIIFFKILGELVNFDT